MRKLTFVMFLSVLLMLTLIVSGCFNTQSMLTYEFYSQSTPASVVHVYVKVESIVAGKTVATYNVNKVVDLADNSPQTIVSNVAVEKPPVSISSLRFVFGKVATVVYNDATATFKIATSTVQFYSYATQQMQTAPLKINGVGQNKIAFVLWNLSEFSTPSTQIFTLNGQAFDKDELLKVTVKYKTDTNGVYFATVSDSSNPITATYEFTKKSGAYDQLNAEYEFSLYAFKAPAGGNYSAYVDVKTATETVASTQVSLGSTSVTLVLQ